MDTKVNYTVVGAFVIGLVAALIFMIIWLSAGITTQTYKYYAIYMNEAVTGLNIDSPVTYNGVEVGTVKTMTLNEKNPQQVKLLLKVISDTPITEDTRATLNAKGLTGITFVSLQNIGPSLIPLKKIPGEEYPIIQAAPSLLNRLDTVVTDLSAELNDISKSLQSVLDTENRHAFKETLQNLNKISANIAANNKNMTIILQNTAKATQQLPITIQTFNNQTLPAANQLLSSLQNVGDNLTIITNQIKQNPSILIRGQTPPPLGPGEK